MQILYYTKIEMKNKFFNDVILSGAKNLSVSISVGKIFGGEGGKNNLKLKNKNVKFVGTNSFVLFCFCSANLYGSLFIF